MPRFAQLVIGPPGSGKSTYCNGMHQFLSAIGRKSSVINLDPANDHVSYPAALDIRSLVTLDEVMENEELGPNGGVLYALEELEHNFEWLENGLRELGDDYVVFDCPGQVELFTHHASLRNVFARLQKLGYRLVVLHLIDSHVLTLPSLYVSALLLSLRSMLQLELPHLNVLTKIDNLNRYPDLPFNLDFYTEVQDLDYILPHLDAERGLAPHPHDDSPDDNAQRSKGDAVGEVGYDPDTDRDILPPPKTKFSALNRAITQLVTDFSLVSFETLAVEDKHSMAVLLRAIDRASGYAFGPTTGPDDSVWQVAMREGATRIDARDVQERWLDQREEMDELERKQWEEEGKAWKGESENAQRDEAKGSEELEMDLRRMGVPAAEGQRRGQGGIEIRKKG